MLKPIIAVKIAGAVFAAIVVTGGGVAIATASNSSHVNSAEQHTQQGEPGQAGPGGSQGQHCGDGRGAPAGTSPSERPRPSETPRPSGTAHPADKGTASPGPRQSGDPDCGKDPCTPAATPSPRSDNRQAGQRDANGENCQHRKEREPGKGDEKHQHGEPGNGPGKPATR